MTAAKQRVKSIYFPEDPAGKGVVAVAFRTDDPEQKALFEAVADLGSTELRELLGLNTWADLERAFEKAEESQSLSAFLRETLGRKVRRSVPDKALPRSGRVIRSAPPGTEDSPERAERYMEWVDEYRREKGVREQVQVIDPFAGTGNFLFAAAARGWASWYCENDAFARRHLELKLAILSRSRGSRVAFARELESLAGRFESLMEHVEHRVGDGITDPAREPLAAAYRALLAPARGRGPLGKDILKRAIAARMVADALRSKNTLLGECFEIAAAWAAGSCAKVRGRAKPDELERRIRLALLDFAGLCAEDLALEARPVFLCEDARDLRQLGRLGVNAMVTSLPPFEAVSQAQPSGRVEAWMLRHPDPGSSGPMPETLARETFELLRSGQPAGPGGGADEGDPRGLTASQIAAFLFESTLPDESIYFRQLHEALGGDFRQMARRIRRAEEDGDPSAPTLRRAGYAAVRYFGMLAQFLEGLMAVWDRSEGGIAVIEVASTSVLDMHVDTPAMVARYLESLRATRRQRHVIERKRSKAGGERVREVLVYAIPVKVPSAPRAARSDRPSRPRRGG
jgi:hypothetical protein